MDNKTIDADCEDSVDLPLTATTSDDGRKVVETEDEAQRKAESDVQKALDETGFGKFNYKVIFVAGLICMNVAFSIMSVGFILPSAACDFDMNTVDKGYLSTAPMFGMVVGSFIWGCIADTKGRRMALLNCVFLQAILECVASVLSNYWGFLALKFFSGLAQSGQLAILYTYLGEFQPTKYREKALSLMEIPWVLGVILVPVIAWLILPINIEYTYAAFTFKSWNLFVVMCALPSFVIGCALLGLPETPKYLASTGRHSDLRIVLTSMYRENTGKSPEDYIVKLDAIGVMYFADRANGYANETRAINSRSENRNNITDAFRNFFQTLYNQTKLLLKPPYIGRTIIICVGAYCILASLYSLTLWFPELFQRFAEFEKKNPGEQTSVCIVSRSLSQPTTDNETIANFSTKLIPEILQENLDPSTTSGCVSTIDTQVYIYTLIMGLSCIPLAIIFPITISRLGFRFFFVISPLACCGVTIALVFVTSSTENLVLSCLYEAFISICATVILCLVVELFPTKLRATVSALASICGRSGALIGNTTFGYLLDDHCLLAIFIVAGHLFLAGVLGFLLPREPQISSRRHPPETAGVPDLHYQSSTFRHLSTQS